MIGDKKINCRISQWIKTGDQWIFQRFPFVRVPQKISLRRILSAHGLLYPGHTCFSHGLVSRPYLFCTLSGLSGLYLFCAWAELSRPFLCKIFLFMTTQLYILLLYNCWLFLKHRIIEMSHLWWLILNLNIVIAVLACTATQGSAMPQNRAWHTLCLLCCCCRYRDGQPSLTPNPLSSSLPSLPIPNPQPPYTPLFPHCLALLQLRWLGAGCLGAWRLPTRGSALADPWPCTQGGPPSRAYKNTGLQTELSQNSKRKQHTTAALFSAQANALLLTILC
jgi:hypothetical protein